MRGNLFEHRHHLVHWCPILSICFNESAIDRTPIDQFLYFLGREQSQVRKSAKLIRVEVEDIR